MELVHKRVVTVIPVDFLWGLDAAKGASELLEKKINKWDFNLRGIPKSYRKIKIIDNKCKILEEPGVILVKIKYIVDYYSPVVGERIIGIAKNWSASEIGVLVDVFNAVVNSDLGVYENSVWKDKNMKEISKETKVSFILEK